MLFVLSIIAVFVALGWLGAALKRQSKNAARLRQINVTPRRRRHGGA